MADVRLHSTLARVVEEKPIELAAENLAGVDRPNQTERVTAIKSTLAGESTAPPSKEDELSLTQASPVLPQTALALQNGGKLAVRPPTPLRRTRAELGQAIHDRAKAIGIEEPVYQPRKKKLSSSPIVQKLYDATDKVQDAVANKAVDVLIKTVDTSDAIKDNTAAKIEALKAVIVTKILPNKLLPK